MNKRQVGYDYEKIAADYLISKGYIIVEKNYHCKLGELDIIARDKSNGKNTLVFIEVKYRRTGMYGSPFEAVDYKKQKKISDISKYYIKERRISPQADMRYDVIGILGNDIQHIQNAFGSM